MTSHPFKPCPKCRGHVLFVNHIGEPGLFKRRLIRGPYLWCTACDWILALWRRK